MTQFHQAVAERMIRYAKVDTQSSNDSTTIPTTMGQFDLARMLAREMKDIGLSDVFLDEEKCLVYGKLASNCGQCRSLGLIAHMDTAPDAPGNNVKPWILHSYDGSDIVLNKEKNIVMKAEEFPSLHSYIGCDLILTDGTTLLGADDKASIAAIMTMAEHLVKNPEIKHGLISIAFTPDEEVGGLAKDLDLKRFGCPDAYTLDGDHLGEYQDETFYASEATIVIHGRSVHTGTAKGIMVNACDVAWQIMSSFPPFEKPAFTEGREGFFHVVSCHATCEEATIVLIIRDHDPLHFKQREDQARLIVEHFNATQREPFIELKIKESYRSMKEIVDQNPHLIANLQEAISSCGIKPFSNPFRGGTDGSSLSHRGLPCPNLSAGYENAHGRFEYVPIQSMEKNVEILLRLAQICAAQKQDVPFVIGGSHGG